MSIDLRALFTPFPVLSTPRLVLRALRPDDLSDLYEYASDREIDQYAPWERYHNIDEARGNLDAFLEEYEKGGPGVWGIEHRADKKLIGITNISTPHPLHRRVELGYTISRAYWGRGYATEAVEAVVQFGFDKMDLVRIEAVVLPEHAASARVLEKSGLRFEGVLHSYQLWKGRPRDLRMYAIVNPKREADP